VERVAREALPLLEAAEDDEGLVHVWAALRWVANMRQHFEEWTQASETELRYARRVGHAAPGVTLGMAVALAFGPRPADEALATLEAVIAEQPYSGALLLRALLLAMLDRIYDAWAVALPAGERLRELGLATVGAWLADIALLAGDYEAAASYLRDACDALEAIGNTGELSSYAPQLGRVLCALGRHDEAEPLAQRGRELGHDEDIWTQQTWRQTQALVHSARSHHAEAERLARKAVGFSLRGDSPLKQGEALRDLAEVLNAAGKKDDAADALEQALECYERKGNVPDAARVRVRLEQLEDASRSPRGIDPASQG
jgi:tetratricopeptide (TPR) repeat protein